MLQVEKKKRGKGRRWLLGAMIGVIAAVNIAFAILMTREEPLPERIDTRGSLVDRETSEIAWMRITVRDREPWTAFRNAEGKMVLESSGDQVMDATLGERIEDALAHLMYEDILTEDIADYADRLAEFGLAEPALIAEVRYADGTEMTIRIGDDSGMEDEDIRFMTVDGDDRLYAVAGNLMEDLVVERELLRTVEQPEIQTSRMDRITVRDGEGGLLAEWALQGEITDADAAENWKVTYPVSYPVDQDQMTSLRKNAGNLRLGLYIGEGTEENLAAYGLKTPKYEIEIHLAAGTTGQIVDGGAYDVREWEEGSQVFLIGDARNDMTDYCLFGGTIYTINHFTVSSLAEVDPMETLARYPVTVAAENLSSLEILREDGNRDLYEITYTSEPAESEGEEDRTIITCRKNGEEMAWSVFEAAYERMLVVDFSGKLPDGWEKKETKETYLLRTLGGRTHTVELSDFDAMHDAVTVDGETVFYLIRGGMPEMP